jgi:2,4-dienoyl-CoA reductase (NADPH2)
LFRSYFSTAKSYLPCQSGACYETELKIPSGKSKKKIAVVGAGPAGLAFAVTAQAGDIK